MHGFFYCPNCIKTHDNWMHGNKLMVCGYCKSKDSIRYNYHMNGLIDGPMNLMGFYVSEDETNMIVNEIFGKSINEFDIDKIRGLASPEFRDYLKKHADDYLKFAYFGFKDAQTVYNEIMERYENVYSGFDFLPSLL